jgi:hypothetical protein
MRRLESTEIPAGAELPPVAKLRVAYGALVQAFGEPTVFQPWRKPFVGWVLETGLQRMVVVADSDTGALARIARLGLMPDLLETWSVYALSIDDTAELLRWLRERCPGDDAKLEPLGEE